MSYLRIEENSLPLIKGKVAVITGGSSGIGYAAAEILVRHGVKVYVLDIQSPKPASDPSLLVYIKCDVTVWKELSSAFWMIGHIDMVFANAGVTEKERFLPDMIPVDGDGQPREPTYPILDVNLKSVLNVIKLSWNIMRSQEGGGSIVLTASSTAYAPEATIPLYSALKATLIGLVRSLRPFLPLAGITINAVAPNATETPLLPQRYIDPIKAASLPVSTPEFVGLALVYSATALEDYRTDLYAMDKESDEPRIRRWNGKVIMTLGNSCTEIEGPLGDLRTVWLGKDNDRLIKAQQAETDYRRKWLM